MNADNTNHPAGKYYPKALLVGKQNNKYSGDT